MRITSLFILILIFSCDMKKTSLTEPQAKKLKKFFRFTAMTELMNIIGLIKEGMMM